MMKFAVINASGEVVSVHRSISLAWDSLEGDEFISDFSVMPIMSADEFAQAHKDYKGYLNGRPSVLFLDVDGSTVYGYVYMIESWDAWVVWTGKQYKDLIQEVSL